MIFKTQKLIIHLLFDEHLQIPRKKSHAIQISTTLHDILRVNSRNISCHGVALFTLEREGGGDKGHKGDETNLRQRRSQGEKAPRDERLFN